MPFMEIAARNKKFCLLFSSCDLGCNHVNETARHGIIAHRLWEENLGNVTKLFVNHSFGFVACRFYCPNAISERNDFRLLFSLLG